MLAPEPPISFGTSLSFATPSLIGSTLSLIVNVHARGERQVGNDGRVHVGKAHPGMFGEDVPTAGLAPLRELCGDLL